MALQPTHARAQLNMGEVHQRMGRPERSMAAYESASRLDPHSSAAYNNLAIAYRNAMPTPRFEDSASAYRAALGLNPQQHQAHFNLGGLLMEIEDYHLNSQSSYSDTLTAAEASSAT